MKFWVSTIHTPDDGPNTEDEGQGSTKDKSWVSEPGNWGDSGRTPLFTFNLSP